MNCNDIRTLLLDHTLQLLTGEQRRQVDQHLAGGCRECQAHLDEMQEAAAMIPFTDSSTATPLAPPVELKSQLMSRVLEDSAPTIVKHPAATEEPQADKPRRSVWRYALAYAAAAAVAFVIGTQWTTPPEPQPQLTQQQREELYRQRMAQIEQSFDATQVRLATATRSTDQTEKQGAVVWDPQAREVHLFAFDLQPATEGQVLQAWLVAGDGTYVPLAVIEPNARGDLAQALAVPREAGDIQSVVVTQQPKAATSPLPTGKLPTGTVRLVAPFGR